MARAIEKMALNKTKRLSKAEVLANRFAKLQSYMGDQLFPHLLEQLQENIDSTSFLDRLYMLEKLKLISSADNWKLFRELRNHLAHEYPENPSLQCAYMNELHKTSQELLGEWDSLSCFIDDKFAIQRPSL